ncbi:MAG: hypothetical protein EDQ89_02205 [Acidobacteria bacterium]|nr:MAG: hypothetical protein EDQ89_02205 [Acidobacteriota bacterium]MCL4286135.1 hypothetical protein [Thermoleophilia bacterium]GIK77292.1 MAG: hypothetical protein BroJett022_09820 [Actinomycetes bacterium]
MSRAQLLTAARAKPVAPYTLDERLTFFCPQENVEALETELVQRFLAWARDDYEPAAGEEPRVLLMVPCQKTKPYTLSDEHVAINSRLLAEGFEPVGPGDPPDGLASDLDPGLLSNAPLVGRGLRIDRVVISEPFAYVPYESIYHWQGELSPCGRYDDPGLFEERGIVPRWRADCTVAGGRWGDNEKAAYVEMHNRMAEQLHAVISRLRDRYLAVIGYVAPTLTHRTFLADGGERRRSGVPASRSVGGDERVLVGVNDLEPGLVEIVPDGRQLTGLRGVLGERLPADLLERPECLDLLVATLRAAADRADPPDADSP